LCSSRMARWKLRYTFNKWGIPWAVLFEIRIYLECRVICLAASAYTAAGG
jgi:hypothetical protein